MARSIHIHIHRAPARDSWNESDHPRADNGQFGSGSGKKLAASGEERSEALSEAEQIVRSSPDAHSYGQHYQAASEIRNALRRSSPAVIVRNSSGSLVGAISWKSSKEALHVQDLGSLQKGAGSMMMQAVEDEAAKVGKSVTLFAEPSAVEFYTKRGYQFDESGKRFAGSSNVLMKKSFPSKVKDSVKPIAAGVVCVAPDRTVLLIKRRPGAVHGGTWGLPAGGVEPFESPREAAFRECSEEVGHALSYIPPKAFWKSDHFWCYQSATPKFLPILNDEHTEHVWAGIDNLPSPLHPNVREQIMLALEINTKG